MNVGELCLDVLGAAGGASGRAVFALRCAQLESYAPGQRLEGRAAVNSEGQRGILLDDKFIPAELPESFPPGTAVELRIVRSGEALVVAAARTGGEAAPQPPVISLPDLLKLDKQLRDLLRELAAYPPAGGAEIVSLDDSHLSDPQLLRVRLAQWWADSAPLMDEWVEPPPECERVIAALRKVASKAADISPEERRLLQALERQAVPGPEQTRRLAEAYNQIEAKDELQLLLCTLEQASAAAPKGAPGLAGRFYDFARQLSDALAAAAGDERRLFEVLEQALDEINADYVVGRTPAGLAILSPELPGSCAAALKSIEAQIRTILGNEGGEGAVRELVAFIDSVDMSGDPRAVGLKAQEFIKELRAELAGWRARGGSRAELHELLRPRLEALGSLIQAAEAGTEPELAVPSAARDTAARILELTALLLGRSEHGAAEAEAPAKREGQAAAAAGGREARDGSKSAVKIEQAMVQAAAGETPPLKAAENIIRGQELLHKLAPLVQAAGEPALLLFPLVLQGFMGKLEIAFYPPEEAGDEASRRKGRTGGYQLLQFKVDLPSLGAVEAALAHKRGELRLQLVTEREDVSRFIEGMLPKLRRRLTSKGYEKLELRVRTAPLREVKPAWFFELIGVDPGVVA